MFTYTVTDANGATSSTTLTINITGTNDAPVAVADTNGGDAVTEAGVNPGNTPFAGDPSATGNVLTNDTDVDTGDTKTVSEVNGSAANVGTAVTGTYGSLTLNADGSWSYALDNADPQTQALAQGAPATDVFTYTVTDANGATSSTTLTINITGTNDAPVAVADTNGADAVTEAGVNPGNTPFAGDPSATGNVLTNDTDVDTGDTKTVSEVNGLAANVGTAVTGTYGSLTLNADGSWTYALDNADPQTQALAQGEPATDVFTYTVTDANGATSSTTLTITITGTNDAPVAVADTNGADAVTEAGVNPGNTPFAGDPSATGNVLTNDTDVDTGDTKTVSEVNGSAANVGTAVTGTYGSPDAECRRQLHLHARQRRSADPGAGAGRVGDRRVHLHRHRRQRRHLVDHADHHHHRHQRRAGRGRRHQWRRCGHRGRRQSRQHAVRRRSVGHRQRADQRHRRRHRRHQDGFRGQRLGRQRRHRRRRHLRLA